MSIIFPCTVDDFDSDTYDFALINAVANVKIQS